MRDIIIWGTGVIARSLYYKILSGGGICCQVKYFVDNAPIQTFYDKDVFRPTRENCSPYLVVVASTIHYDEIAVQLTEFGLQELKDFIPYQALGKEVVLVHGNCHKQMIEEYLKTSRTFAEKFWIYPIPMIQHNSRGYIKEHLLRNCDVFIYQDIQENNPYDKRLSAEYLSAKVCKRRICIPNVFGFGRFLFPQAVLGRNDSEWHNPTGQEIPGGLFNYRDENIDRLWTGGERNIHKIAEYLEGPIYEKAEMEERLIQCFEKMKEREKLWDIKIVDYIENRYQEEQMFYEPAHPCNNILRKISEGIAETLGIEKDEIGEITISFGVSEMPIYNCVKETLGLKYGRKYIRDIAPLEQSKLIDGDMDLLEYCKEYCYWCFGYYSPMCAPKGPHPLEPPGSDVK